MAMVASTSSPGPHHHHHHHHHHHRHHLNQTANKLTRSLERILEEAHLSGELKLSGRKLKDFPVPCSNNSTTNVQSKFDLIDTVIADLSKNRFSELPAEVTEFCSLERLLLYHNAIRSVPDTVVYLQSLTYLDLSRNQLTSLPATLCQLPLEVLLVSNNKLTRLPDEMGLVKTLTELDASCNELQGLPPSIGELPALRALNLRRNHIVQLPVELTFLKLVRLNISCNRITRLPVELRRMSSLESLDLHHNPLTSPPADVCTRGRVHVFKYLETQDTSSKNSRTNDDLHHPRRSVSNASSSSGSLAQRRIANRTGFGRYTIDSGYSTSDGISQPDSRPSSTAEPDFGVISRSIPIPVNGSSNGGSGSSTPSTISPGDSSLTLEQELTKAMMLSEQMERRRAASAYDPNASGDTSPRLRVIHANTNGSPRFTPTKISPLTNGTIEEEKKPLEHIQTYREYKEALRQQRSAFDVYRPRGTPSVTISPNGDSPATYQVNGTASTNGEIDSNGRHLNSPHHETVNRPSPTHPNQPPPPPPGQQQSPILNGTKAPSDFLRTNGLSYVKPSSPVRSSSLNESVSGTNPTTNNVRVLRASVGFIGTHPRRQWGETPESPTPPPPDRFSFTMRREFDKAKEEAELVKQLRHHIETRLKMSLPEDMAPALTDGVVLCHLANHIRPRSVASIHVPSPAVPKLTMARCRRNVDNFLEACRRIGVEEAADVTSRLMIEDEVFGVNLPLLGRIVHALIGQTTTTTKRTETLQTRTDSRTSSLPPPKPDTGDKGAFGSALSILGFLLTLILLYCFPMSS